MANPTLPRDLAHAVVEATGRSVIAAWAAFAGVAGVGRNRLAGLQPRSPWALDLLAFLTLILPVILTFSYLEGSHRQATFGKHRLRLVVVDAAGGPPGFRRELASDGAPVAA